MPSRQHPPLSIVRLVVSSNGEQYSIVDVSGAGSGSRIRDQILSKLSIAPDSRGYFFVYPSEIGQYALGGALSDQQLFSVCSEHGDPSGSVKFFVSTSPDRPPSVNEPGYLPERAPSILMNQR